MADSIHLARLTRSRRAHLLAVVLLLGVVLAAGCAGSPAMTAPASPAPASAVVSDCLLPPASCYAPYVFRVVNWRLITRRRGGIAQSGPGPQAR